MGALTCNVLTASCLEEASWEMDPDVSVYSYAIVKFCGIEKAATTYGTCVQMHFGL